MAEKREFKVLADLGTVPLASRTGNQRLMVRKLDGGKSTLHAGEQRPELIDARIFLATATYNGPTQKGLCMTADEWAALFEVLSASGVIKIVA